jgi:hypothetical protein
VLSRRLRRTNSTAPLRTRAPPSTAGTRKEPSDRPVTGSSGVVGETVPVGVGVTGGSGIAVSVGVGAVVGVAVSSAGGVSVSVTLGDAGSSAGGVSVSVVFGRALSVVLGHSGSLVFVHSGSAVFGHSLSSVFGHSLSSVLGHSLSSVLGHSVSVVFGHAVSVVVGPAAVHAGAATIRPTAENRTTPASWTESLVRMENTSFSGARRRRQLRLERHRLIRDDTYEGPYKAQLPASRKMINPQRGHLATGTVAP